MSRTWTANRITRDRVEATDRLVQRAKESALGDDWKAVFQLINSLSPRERAPKIAVHNDAGEVCTDKEDEYLAWSQHVLKTFNAEIISDTVLPPVAYEGAEQIEWKGDFEILHAPTSVLLQKTAWNSL